MERITEHRIILAWNFDGHFSAVIVNGKTVEVKFCEPGKGTDDVGACVTSIDPKYLRNLNQALTELFKEEAEQQKILGYSFPVKEEEHGQET